MATFKGTLSEFEKFIGPRVRNIVQTSISRKRRNEIKTCESENCNKRKNLEAAHIHGNGRKELIRNAYENNVDENNQIDLNKFEEDFIQSHYPIEDTIKILCKDCHNEYDKVTEEIVLQEKPVNPQKDINENVLPIELYPNDIDEFKELLLQYKQAYIRIYYNNGSTETRIWKAARFTENSDIFRNLRSRTEFRQGNWQNLNITNVEVEIKY